MLTIITLTILQWLIYAALLYFGSAFIFLLAARIEEDESGNLVLNAKSWHFKIAYPKGERSERFKPRYGQVLVNGAVPNVSICVYYPKFLLMLLLVWPFMLLWQFSKCLVYSPFFFLFGYYVKPWEIKDLVM